MDRRRFLLRTAGAVIGAGAGVVGYTIGIEPHWLEIVARDLPIAALPRELEGKRLAQVSDIHVGPQVSDDYLIRSFKRLRALAPDIVIVTGDFISYVPERGEAQFLQLRRVLSHLPNGTLATIGILGNHDYGVNWAEPEVALRVASEAERAGIRILRNEVATVAGMDVIGVDDLWANRSDSTAALSARRSTAAIALCHNPDGLDRLPWTGYRGWILAGHTHGGQCKPPFLPPPLLPVRNPRYTSGAIAVDIVRNVYISRGIGHLTRARFNVRPEITMFTLRSA